MNVLFALPRPGNTGGMRMLTQMYFDEKVFDRDDTFFFDTYYSWGENKLIRLFQNFYLKLKFTCVLLFKKIDVAYIMTSSNMGFYDKVVYCLLARCLGKKVVLNPVGGQFIDFYNRNGFNRTLVPLCLRIPSGIVAGTTFWNEFFQRTFRIKNLIDIPNPVRLKIRRSTRRSLEKITITFLARLDPSKGAIIFAKSVKRLFTLRQDFRVNIAGTGPAHDEVMSILKEEIARGKVILHGFVSESKKEQILDESHIYVLPTEFEVLPISVLEAMSHGNVVIATRVGGMADAVVDGTTGFLIEPDEEELITKIVTLMDDPSLIHRFSEAALKQVVQFEFSTIFNRQRAFCEQVLTKKV